jgi:flagellar hook assembly protein FlgD
VDDQGRLYLANTGNQNIEIYGVDGTFLFAFDGKGKHSGMMEASWVPSSVAFIDDGSLANNGGRIYVTDSANHKVQKFGLDGNHLMTFGGFGAAHGQFDQPAASSANGQGAIYVADAGNQRLEKFSQPVISMLPTPTPGPVLTINLTANPDVFDPAVTSTILAYTLGQAANVSLVITNGTSNIVFQQSYVGGSFGGLQGMNQVVWNGLSGGKPLPDGAYTVTLQATVNGQKATAQVIVTIQSGAVAPAFTPTPINTSTPTPVPPTPTPTPIPFSIQGFSLNPSTIDRGNSTDVLFTLPAGAQMTIQVVDKNGKLVYTTTFTGTQGSNSHVYDGSRNVGSGLGGTLPPGTYTFILSGTALGGSDSKQTTLTVTP